MSVNCTSLGKRISFYRSKSNLSQEALAAKINCSREHIVRIENGTKIPSISVLVEIANTLSVSADELLLDCLEHSSSSANSEFHRLLLDCNETEQTVIIRICLTFYLIAALIQDQIATLSFWCQKTVELYQCFLVHIVKCGLSCHCDCNNVTDTKFSDFELVGIQTFHIFTNFRREQTLRCFSAIADFIIVRSFPCCPAPDP